MTVPTRPLAVNRATAKLVFFDAPRKETEPMRLQCLVCSARQNIQLCVVVGCPRSQGVWF